MSWELVSFLILAAVLIAGFAWYERSRPPAQVVALVAALAALAIVGRIAFAAFPNVKPTTDIVIFAGYALGGAPGFAVGALAALVSNFWFGQGPWTPWQMAGWGFCGILGAGLALSGRRPGRITLAVICGLAGIAYGALLNFSLMATYGGELSLERFLVFEGRAIPFDAAHAIGNVVFALIAGPALIRMLVRFRARFEWSRDGAPGPGKSPGDPEPPRPPRRGPRPALRTGGVALLFVAALLVGSLAPARGAESATDRGAQWLRGAQNPDGGWGASPDDDSGPEMTAWAMLGLEAAGVNPLDVSRSGKTPVDYLRSQVEELRSPGDLARTTIALLGAGVDPKSFGGRNLVADLRERRRDNGSYEGWPNSTAFAVIALRAADAGGGTEKSVEWLRRVQNDDGGWGDVPKAPSNADGTGAVLQVLSPDSKAANNAVVYLQKAQHKGGGFPLGSSGTVNTQSTGWAVQGLVAADRNPDSFRRGDASALDYLANNQADDGSYRYSKSSDQTPVWVTGQVLVAAAEKAFPLSAPKRAPKPKNSATEVPEAAITGGATAGPTISPAPESAPESIEPPPQTSPNAGAGAPSPSTQSGANGNRSNRGSADGDAKAPGPATEVEEAGAGEESPAAPLRSSEPETEDSDSSGVAGAIVLGALAGCILFGLGLATRKGWMHWRYGL